MGFSAGVMLYVSFVEILNESNESFQKYWRERNSRHKQCAAMATTGVFFLGCLLTALLDRVVHQMYHTAGVLDEHGDITLVSGESVVECTENSETKSVERLTSSKRNATSQNSLTTKRGLYKTAFITALAMALHNFPEGLATFISLVESAGAGIPLAVAIAIHNIPEGICVAVPILYATGSKWRAFLWVCCCFWCECRLSGTYLLMYCFGALNPS
jgi:ZIP family zinc transporter